jgi:S1-C subfamily serine protease
MAEKGGALLVDGVVPGSPAEKAGILAGDELVSFDGKPVKESVDVVYLVGEKREGDKASVTVRRAGEEKTFEVTFFRFHRKKPH